MGDFDPFGAFESTYNIASKGRKPLEGVLDAFDEEQKLNRDIRLEREKAKVKQSSVGQTGVFSFNPLTGSFDSIASVPKGSIVRNTLSEEDLMNKAMVGQEASARGEQMKSGSKLGTAVKRLSVISRQFNRATPTSTNPLAQRFLGPASVIGAKTGIVPNPELMALKKMSRPVSIQLVRAFGEVGNLSESDIQSAADTVSLENMTEKERLAQVKQFAEFALAGAPPEARNFMMRDQGVASMMKSIGLSLDDEVGRADSAPDASSTSNEPIDPKSRFLKKAQTRGWTQ